MGRVCNEFTGNCVLPQSYLRFLRAKFGNDEAEIEYYMRKAVPTAEPISKTVLFRPASVADIPAVSRLRTEGVRELTEQDPRLQYACPEFNSQIDLVGVMSNKQSASDTIIAFGDTRTEPVRNLVFKISFARLPNNKDDSLEVEALIYMSITNLLVLNGVTPHIVLSYGMFMCRDQVPQSLLGNANYFTEIDESVKNGAENEYDLANMRLLALEKSGPTLSSLLRFSNVTYHDIVVLIVQMAYTLACFEEIGLIHNDLHSGNVFVQQLDSPETNFYRLDDDTVLKVTSGMQVRLYDFDRSFKVPTEYEPQRIENGLLRNSSLCRVLGQCNRFTPRLDFFRFLYYVYEFGRREQMRAVTELVDTLCINGFNYGAAGFLSSQHGRAHLPFDANSYYTWAGVACKCANSRCLECYMENPVPVMSPIEVLYALKYSFPANEEDDISLQNTWMLPSLAHRAGRYGVNHEESEETHSHEQ